MTPLTPTAAPGPTHDEENETVSEPAIRIFFRVDTRSDFLDGCPFPWEPGQFGWTDLGPAMEQAENIRKNHVASGAGHRLDIRVVKVKEDTVRRFRDPAYKESPAP